MEDEFVPQAFLACLGTAPQGCGNSAQRNPKQRSQGNIWAWTAAATGCYSPPVRGPRNARASIRAIMSLVPQGRDFAAKPKASGTQHPPAAAILGIRGF